VLDKRFLNDIGLLNFAKGRGLSSIGERRDGSLGVDFVLDDLLQLISFFRRKEL
jgi:hypothetical protein